MFWRVELFQSLDPLTQKIGIIGIRFIDQVVSFTGQRGVKMVLWKP